MDRLVEFIWIKTITTRNTRNTKKPAQTTTILTTTTATTDTFFSIGIRADVKTSSVLTHFLKIRYRKQKQNSCLKCLDFLGTWVVDFLSSIHNSNEIINVNLLLYNAQTMFCSHINAGLIQFIPDANFTSIK